MQCVR